jgi:hypothetical protein
MDKETQNNNQTEPKVSKEVNRKIHQTHFPVTKVQLRNDDYDSGYEWIKSGIGRLKRVLKKTENM